ncbi:OPT/YSL family transporter [Streptomyces sp. NPDC091416]|uniref:OPT/YSL family transporter n=1 Tax=Streptomyces sp. NPDC091416 TaxID=3366003 RepID=UPI003817FDA8
MTDQQAPVLPKPSTASHPRALAPSILVLCVGVSLFGAVVGIQVLTSLGITPSTSLIGALVAMTLARIPLAFFRRYRSVHVQNLVQTSISSATFGAANSLFLPIGIPYLFGLHDMVVPMLIGVSVALLWDAWLLYRMYDTPAFAAANPWPVGIAAAEAIRAGDQGGRRAMVLGGGLLTGVLGAWLFALPMSAFGVAMIGGIGAMIAFGAGLLTLAYLPDLSGWDLASDYVPHGMMIGAGLVALVQVGALVRREGRPARSAATAGVRRESTRPLDASGAGRGTAVSAGSLGRSLGTGALGYLVIAVGLAFGTGIVARMSVPMLIGFLLYAGVAALVHELLVGIAAMHSGWFPAFALALITLLIGILIGFPPEALVVLAGFTAATGPAFADMGYDFKTGHLLRGEGADPLFELEGRRQQLIAGMIGFVVAIAVVSLSYHAFFARGQVAPINAAYVAAIKAGMSSGTATHLLLWALPGALLQIVGGSRRQLGVLFATGLLISTPWAGWMVLAGLAVRLAVTHRYGKDAKEHVEVFAGGVIAGDALYAFGNGVYRATKS